jgi:hypothetical protein
MFVLKEGRHTEIDKNIMAAEKKLTLMNVWPHGRIWTWLGQGIPYQTVSVLIGVIHAIRQIIVLILKKMSSGDERYENVLSYHPDTVNFHTDLVNLLDKHVKDLVILLRKWG